MTYRIEYGCGVACKKSPRKSSINLKPILLSVVILAAAAFLLWPDGRIAIRDLILPGDEEVTAAALSGLVDDLKDGQTIGSAVDAFCREIIAGA